MPLNNSRIIRDDWQEHHYPTVDLTMTAKLQLLRPDLIGTRVLGDKKTVYAKPKVLWAGPARIESFTGQTAAAALSGGAPVTENTYLVSCPVRVALVGPRVNDYFICVNALEVPALSGKILHVENVPLSSLAFEFDLRCDMRQATDRGAGG